MSDNKNKSLNGIDDGGKRMSYGEGKAIREPSEGKGRYDLITPFGLERLAKWYELGARKYADRNWEKGMPFSRCIDSAKRHINKYLTGMNDEDHLSAAVWNLLCIIHFEELDMTDLNDLPFYLSKKRYNKKETSKEESEENCVNQLIIHSIDIFTKPCPICGNKKIDADVYIDKLNTGYINVRVGCSECSCSINKMYRRGSKFFDDANYYEFPSLEEQSEFFSHAITVWNKRMEDNLNDKN